MTAQTPWLLWLVLLAGGIAVGGAMLAVAFYAFNRRESRQGFEVKTDAAGGEPAALREKETNHG